MPIAIKSKNAEIKPLGVIFGEHFVWFRSTRKFHGRNFKANTIKSEPRANVQCKMYY